MTLPKLFRLLVTLGAFALLILAIKPFTDHGSLEDSYPGKPIKIIVPFKPGGGSDRIARVLDNFTKEEFGSSFIFVYKPGGGGHLGLRFLANSKPDGYMLATYNTPDLVLGHMTGIASYEIDDLVVLGQIAFDANVFAASHDSPFSDMKDFLDEARERPGKLRLGISQPKGGNHLATLAMIDDQGVDLSVVIFSGGTELASAVLGKQVDAGIGGLAPFLGSMEQTKFLAISGDKRLQKIPEITTMIEQGIPMNSGTGRVMLAPAGLEEFQLDRLKRGLKNIFDNEDFKTDLRKIGNEPSWLDGDQVSEYLNAFQIKAQLILEKTGLN
ncbi:MAG: tripartite tricarboxylate transporter substrate binding protein [Verrucomicrobia bacterium]|nr:tripartite tricarboxylate transporter substrate binding protein [Verrucomicrobiota bacterium]